MCDTTFLLGIKIELCFNYVCVDSDISALKNILDCFNFVYTKFLFY